MADTRPPCPHCEDGKVKGFDCRLCYGSGRVPRVVNSGKIKGVLPLAGRTDQPQR